MTDNEHKHNGCACEYLKTYVDEMKLELLSMKRRIHELEDRQTPDLHEQSTRLDKKMRYCANDIDTSSYTTTSVVHSILDGCIFASVGDCVQYWKMQRPFIQLDTLRKGLSYLLNPCIIQYKPVLIRRSQSTTVLCDDDSSNIAYSCPYYIDPDEWKTVKQSGIQIYIPNFDRTDENDIKVYEPVDDGETIDIDDNSKNKNKHKNKNKDKNDVSLPSPSNTLVTEPRFIMDIHDLDITTKYTALECDTFGRYNNSAFNVITRRLHISLLTMQPIDVNRMRRVVRENMSLTRRHYAINSRFKILTFSELLWETRSNIKLTFDD